MLDGSFRIEKLANLMEAIWVVWWRRLGCRDDKEMECVMRVRLGVLLVWDGGSCDSNLEGTMKMIWGSWCFGAEDHNPSIWGSWWLWGDSHGGDGRTIELMLIWLWQWPWRNGVWWDSAIKWLTRRQALYRDDGCVFVCEWENMLQFRDSPSTSWPIHCVRGPSTAIWLSYWWLGKWMWVSGFVCVCVW